MQNETHMQKCYTFTFGENDVIKRVATFTETNFPTQEYIEDKVPGVWRLYLPKGLRQNPAGMYLVWEELRRLKYKQDDNIRTYAQVREHLAMIAKGEAREKEERDIRNKEFRAKEKADAERLERNYGKEAKEVAEYWRKKNEENPYTWYYQKPPEAEM